jgi:hypothetical protein
MTVPARFIHVSFSFSGAVPDLTKLEELFNLALDWIRYGTTAWILYSNTDLDTWRDRIRACPAVKDTDAFLITEFNSNYSGYQLKSTWDWLQKTR